MRKLLGTFAAGAFALSLALGCSSGDDPDSAEEAAATEPPQTTKPAQESDSVPEGTTGDDSVATTEAAPPAEPTPTTRSGTVDVGDVALTDPAVTEPAVEVCEAMGELDTDGGLDALMALFTEDAAVTDATLNEQHSGTEELSTYFSSLAALFGIEQSQCGAVIQSEDWVAGTYTLYSADGPISQGIAAVHVTDGKVDRQINHYTPVPNSLEPPTDSGRGVLSVASQLCEAWANDDAQRATDVMAPDIVVHTARDFAGVDEVTAFFGSLPYDIHTCGVEIQNYQWEAIESVMTDPGQGIERSMLHILRLSPDELVEEQWVYFDAPAT